MMSERKSDKRHWLQRLTPGGWAIILTLGGLTILLVIGVITWAAPRVSTVVDLPILNRPTPTSVVPTFTPRPTASPLPEPTATPTSTVNFPAYWSDGMWQDANDQWWPADDVREEVIGMVKQQYREINETIWDKTNDVVFDELTDEDLNQYLTGRTLEDFVQNRQEYLKTGSLPSQQEMVVTESRLTIRDFQPDGLSCTVAEMYQAALLLTYDSSTDSWTRVEIPENGLLDGVQYLGTALYRMEYDSEDGRWKQERLIDWLPRP
jgi:hypothetical protein